MQKILNDPDAFVDELLEGMLSAHPRQLKAVGRRAVVRADAPVAGKVAIATGGGSGNKVAGARAEEGASLAEVRAVTEKAAANLRSMGVALSPCTVPTAGRPTFELPEGEMEIGMESTASPASGAARSSRRIGSPRRSWTRCSTTCRLKPATRPGCSSTDLGQRRARSSTCSTAAPTPLLADAGIRIGRVWVGEYATSLEMAGASISLLKLDEELARLLESPAESPFFMQR